MAKAAAAPPHGPLIRQGRQGSSRSAEDAIGTFQRFRGRDVTAQVVPRGRTVVTFPLQCYGLILAEMNPDEHSQGIVWQGRAGNGIGIGMGDGKKERANVDSEQEQALVLSSVARMSISVAVILYDVGW